MITGLKLTATGFTGVTNRHGMSVNFSAGFPLYLIEQAWQRGLDLEQLADGFGPGLGTMGGDWSGIRDSSDEAIERMLEASLNFLFGETA